MPTSASSAGGFATVGRVGRPHGLDGSFVVEDASEEPRLGLAVPKRVGSAVSRNRVKRRVRELWRARLESIPTGCDYVLVVRPGLVEAAESRGADWLGERLDEVLGKASA